MWIKPIPKKYYNMGSCFSNNVFLWRNENVFVMDNHMAALWGWLQVCDVNEQYNFMHIDRHYDMLCNFKCEDLDPVIKITRLEFKEFCCLKRSDGYSPTFSWDNYIMAGYVMFPNWFHTNIFLTHKCGSVGRCLGFNPMKINEKELQFMEWYISNYIGNPCQDFDGFDGEDYTLPWIVNLDLDVFYTEDSRIQLFSDDYIKHIAELLQNNLSNIAALTIAISPCCLGGKSMRDKWNNGIRLLSIMSEKLDCLKLFINDFSSATSRDRKYE